MSMRGTAILLSPLRKPLEGAVLIRGLLRESEIEIGARNRPTKPYGYMPRASGYPANPERTWMKRCGSPRKACLLVSRSVHRDTSARVVRQV